MQTKGIIVSTLIILALVIGCDGPHVMTAVEFMYATEYKLRVGGITYSKYSSKKELDKLDNCGPVVLTVLIHDYPEYEVLLTKRWQRLNGTMYEVRYAGG